jgi:phosphomannomutase
VAAQSVSTNLPVSVIITASHNPAADNGFKFFTGGREFIKAEEEALERHIFSRDFTVVDWSNIGSVIKTDIKQAYLKKVKTFLSSRGGEVGRTRVLVDLANGAATRYTPELLGELGFHVTTVNSHPDGYFPGRLPEPSPGNLVDTMKLGAGSDFAVTLCHDGDGDRLAVIDEKGRFIDQNRVIALFAKDEVDRKNGGMVVTSIDTSSVIDEVVGKAGGEVTRVPLGSLQEQLVADKQRLIVFASEPWKAIFTDLGDWMDGIAGAGRFAQMVREVGQDSCIRLMSSIPEYPMLRDQVACPDVAKSKFMASVRRMLLSEVTGVQRVLDIDGIRIECSDGSYLLVRPSGTEPKARVYIGARTQASLDKLARIAKNAINRALEESITPNATG